MRTYLLTWNPKRYRWKPYSLSELSASMGDHNGIGYVELSWSCGKNTRIRPGDRVFMLRQGAEPRGLFASGWAVSVPYEDAHWEDDARTGRYIDVCLDVLLDPDSTPIFERDRLNEEPLDKAHWDTQSSGIVIPEPVAEALEMRWASFLESMGKTSSDLQHRTSDGAEPTYVEGATRKVQAEGHERNRAARRACIAYYGWRCVICDFDFEETYGELGADYIHVHHLAPVATADKPYIVDPITDLRPVCANCHAMLHRRPEPLAVEELRAILQKRA